MVARKIAPKASRRSGVAEQAWTDADVFVFDVEGTLVDAMMPTLRCWRETLEAFGHDLSLAEIHHCAGMDASEMLARLLPDTTKNERQELIERQGAHFREDYVAHIPALPCARALLEDLKSESSTRGLKLPAVLVRLRHHRVREHRQDRAAGEAEDERDGVGRRVPSPHH